MVYIKSFSKAEIDNIPNEALKIIVKRTIEFRQVKKSINDFKDAKFLQYKAVRLFLFIYIKHNYFSYFNIYRLGINIVKSVLTNQKKKNVARIFLLNIPRWIKV